MSDPFVDEIAERFRSIPDLIVRIKCTQASPLLVQVNGQGSIPAQAMAGSTFALNDTGYALWQPPLPPHCYKVT